MCKRPFTHPRDQQLDTYIGERIKSRREKLGFTRAELAATLGIDDGDLEAIEAGTLRPDPTLLAKASDALIAPLYWFFPLQNAPEFESIRSDPFPKPPMQRSPPFGPGGICPAMPGKEITCPDCGLVLRVKDDEEGLNLNYFVSEWGRLCARRDLVDPAWCLLQRDRTTLLKKKN